MTLKKRIVGNKTGLWCSIDRTTEEARVNTIFNKVDLHAHQRDENVSLRHYAHRPPPVGVLPFI